MRRRPILTDRRIVYEPVACPPAAGHGAVQRDAVIDEDCESSEGSAKAALSYFCQLHGVHSQA